MTITKFKFNDAGPLEIIFPNQKNVQLSLAVEWTDNLKEFADLKITYSVEGNNSNICFDNKSKKLSVEHNGISQIETIHELVTFSISGNSKTPSDQFELKAIATIDNETTPEKIITVLIKS
ncbi:MAG: hypothetical protein IPP64_11950 [Bacteroidetes bacterium]|nr:hypothetical protein [Bacteroidota bacterium]